ncbi:MAG: amino acid--tRNA ligase-related protein, partial [Myxococcota bacterium]
MTLDGLAIRAKVLRALREFFWQHDFLEVETPTRVPSPGLDLHLDAFPSEDRWLITSPEYQMKRLLAAGATRIVQVGRCFRKGEIGAHHEPEFTMAEWYRA